MALVSTISSGPMFEDDDKRMQYVVPGFKLCISSLIFLDSCVIGITLESAVSQG